MKNIFTTLIILCAFTAKAEVDELWKNNKITTSQPFPAQVIAIKESWVGFELLLKEVNKETPRYCYINIAFTFDLNYQVTTLEKSEKLLINAPKAAWQKLKKPTLVSDFNYTGSIYSLGKTFKEKDLLRQKTKQTK